MATLPGGYWDGNNCLRSYNFRPLTGELELAIIEADRRSASLPVRVSLILEAALESLFANKPSYDAIHDLSVVDRQYLMRELALMLGHDGFWHTEVCNSCENEFDFEIINSQFPVGLAGETYPYISLETSQGKQQFRVPTGRDQEIIMTSVYTQKTDSPEKVLANLCLCANKLMDFSEDDIKRIDLALEDVSPGVVTRISAACPECEEVHEIELDPYYLLDVDIESDLFESIHAVASAYHWSEADIFRLNRRRRQMYIDMIERDL